MLAFLAQSALIMSPVGSMLKALFGWLKTLSFWQLVCLALAGFALIQHFELASARRQAVNYRRQFEHEHAARLSDRQAYIKAQADAAAANKAQVQQVEQQYQRNSDDERQAYLRDLAELRRMRSPAPGSAGATIAPPSPAPAGGADGDALHLSPDEHVQASEIELRLMHLQLWVEKQLQVNPN